MLLLSAAQCKKDVSDDMIIKPETIDTIKPAPVFRDTFAVWKNGVKWNAIGDGLFYSTSSESRFYLRGTKTASTSVKEWFYLSDIPCKAGNYSVDDGRSLLIKNNSVPQAMFVYVVDGDQGGGTFYTDTSRIDNFVTIMHYDSLTKIIEGKFKVMIKIDKKVNNLPGIPDTISMTNGYFRVKLK